MARQRNRKLRGYTLNLEHLEDRLVPTVAGDFVFLQGKLKEYLDSAHGLVQTVVDGANAKLPFVDKSLAEMTGTKTVLNEFKGQIDKALVDIGKLQDNQLEAQAGALLDKYLGYGPDGVQIELKDVQGNVMPAQVSLPHSATDPLIDIKLHLGKTLSTPDFKLSLGLDSMPFQTHISANVAPKFTVGFKIATLEFGVKENTDPATHGQKPLIFFINPIKLELTAEASLINPLIDAEIGFLHATLKENPANPTGNNLQASFGVDINFDPSNEKIPLVSKPLLTGGAHVDVLVTAGFTDAELAAPSIQSNFILDWNFSNNQTDKKDHTFGSSLNVAFNKVQVSLGSYLTKMVGPAIQKIQQFTEPYKDFFKMLGDPVPVISDIAKIFGDKDGVSILDLAGIASDVKQMPADYALLIKIAKAVIEVTNVIDSIRVAKGDDYLKNAWIDLGDFDLIGNQAGSTDIREVTSAVDTGFGNIAKKDWSSLQKLVDSPEFINNIKAEIKSALGDDVGGTLGQALGDALDNLKKVGGLSNSASINLSFPLTDKPAAAIFGLLIGQDTDLISFEAKANIEGAGDAYLFQYQGFEVKLTGGLKVDAYLRLAYDTFGLRTIVTNFIATKGASGESNNMNIGQLLLEGLYLDPDTHLKIEGTLGVEAGANYTFASAYIAAHLDAGIHVYIPDGQDANGDGHVRPSEFTDNLFNIDGELDGSLDLHATLGIDPVAVHFDQTLANGKIFDFHLGGTNPFEPGPDVMLASSSNGVLTLNMGNDARRGARNYQNDEHNESFVVSHAGSGPDGEIVLVTAFGFTQKFPGITSIVADGDDGSDSITIDDKVTSSVNLKGGIGTDTIVAAGTGNASIEGGDGNDELTGGIGISTIKGDGGNDLITAGSGNATMYGGEGDDKIFGGAGSNTIYGDKGDDYLVGGTGQNTIFGGMGNDRLFAGIMSGDYLNGEDGNDALTPGTGFTKMIGGNGNDQFFWRFLDPDNGVKQSDGGVDIDGGLGIDIITLFGGPTEDTFNVSKTVGDNLHEILIKAPLQAEGGALGFTAALLNQVENIDIEAGEGADKITINELTNTRVQTISVNTNDLIKSHYGYGDNKVDQIIVNGTNKADNVTLQAKQVQIQVPKDTESTQITGGITTITGLQYYTIQVANVNDDLRFNALDGNDTVNVLGITGPTLVRGNGNATPVGTDDDTFNVTAQTLQDYTSALNIDADGGNNALKVNEPGSYADTFVFTQSRIESDLLKAVNYAATGGNYSAGVTLTAGTSNDKVYVKNTLPNVLSTIKTGKGNDSIIVGSQAPDMTGNLAGIVGTFSVDAGEGTGNLLTVSDGGSTSGNQNVLIDGTKIAGMAGFADNTLINYAATGGALTLNLLGSNSPTLVERYVVNNPNAKLVLNTQDGNDKVDITAMSKDVEVQGGAGNDQITVGYGTNKLDAITGALKVTGGLGNDTLNVVDSQTASGKTYTLGNTTIARNGAGIITFDGSMEATNLSTSNFNDEVVVLGMPIAKVNVEGGAGTDRLTGPNSNNTWFVQGLNRGALGATVGFNNVEKLLGGAGNDRFAFSNGGEMQGLIDGGLGNNVLDYASYSAPVTVNTQAKTATRTAGFQNVKEFVGGTASDLFIAPDLANGWSIQGRNSGQVSNLAQGIFKFSGFENLQGGTGSDGFQFTTSGQVDGKIDGKIDGKGGIDTLDYSAFTATMPIQVNLFNGTASRVGGLVAGIENVNGGAGDDLIVGDGQANTFNGNAGRDVLIGGAGADILNGGTGEDLLIGGTTAYDKDVKMVALNTIMQEWASNQTYSIRRQHLLGKLAGGKNGSNILSKTLLPDDAALDKLTGGTIDTDWFWSNNNEILDLNQPAGEKVGDIV